VCRLLFLGTDVSLRAQLAVLAAGLFIACMVCHGELYRLRPQPHQLTGYYLGIAAGGALGGVFVGLVAPRLFTDYHEFHWGWGLCGLLLVGVCLRDGGASHPAQWRAVACLLTLWVFGGLDRGLVWLGEHHPTVSARTFATLRLAMWGALGLIVASWILRGRWRTFRSWQGLACAWLVTGWVALGGALWLQARQSPEHVIHRSRNFFGALKVLEYRRDDPQAHYRLLQHGRITHGLQFVCPERAVWPTSYYAAGSGVALAVAALPASPRRIGVVGLGTGTMAAHGRPGDTLRFYEIDPAVVQLAATRFTYLSRTPATVEVVPGDARLSLERESPQHYDLLVLDAFSSDAIPVHLLTGEAFALYGRHLQPHGIIAVHISNHYLDLAPVLVNVARHFGYGVACITYEEEADDKEQEEAAWWAYASTWVLLSRDQSLLGSPAIRRAASPVRSPKAGLRLWTDDFASVLQILR